MISNAEVATLTEMFSSGYRLDGRSLTEYREITFQFPRSNHPDSAGCCVVKIGATAVMAQVSTEVVEPKHFHPSQGMLFVNFDANLLKIPRSNLHHPHWKRKRDDEGRRLSAVLQTLLRDSIDLDALCIVAWERVFAVRVELRALSYDGNLGDCGSLAAVAALAAYRRPDVFVDDNGKVIVDIEGKHRPRVPLGIRRVPVLVTLGLTSDTKIILVDPNAREEAILTDGRVMIGMTSFREICCLYTTGLTVPMHSNALTRSIHLANSKAQSLISLVHRVLNGLNLQRQVSSTATHARSTELAKVVESSLQAPLVLSSINFLPDEVNKTQGSPVEEGEILYRNRGLGSDSDTDMEISGSDDQSPKPSVEKIPKSKLQPYGVIEVPSLPNEPDEAAQLVEYSENLLESYPVYIPASNIDMLASTREVNKGLLSKAKDSKYSDEDEEVVVLNLQ